MWPKNGMNMIEHDNKEAAKICIQMDYAVHKGKAPE